MNTMTAEKPSGIPTALLSLVLAFACPPLTILAAEICKRAGSFIVVVTPIVMLGVVSTFVFHVRFAIPALDGRRRGGAPLAALALVVGVVGFLIAVPYALALFTR